MIRKRNYGIFLIGYGISYRFGISECGTTSDINGILLENSSILCLDNYSILTT